LVSGDDPTATQPTGFWEKYGPPITQAGGAVVGGMVAKKAQQGALERSPEEAASLAGAMGAAKGMGQAGTSLLNESRPYMAQPASYYQTLLRGSRGAMANAVAGSRGVLNDTYRGQSQQLQQAGVRGAARQQLQGDINRNRASQVAKLTTGVQPYAADELAKLGTTMAQTATPLAGNAGNIYARLLDSGANNRAAAILEGEKTGKPIGQLIADLGKVAFTPKKPGAGNPANPGNVDYGSSTTVRQPGYEYGSPADDYRVGAAPPMPPVAGDYDPNDYGRPYDPNATYGYD